MALPDDLDSYDSTPTPSPETGYTPLINEDGTTNYTVVDSVNAVLNSFDLPTGDWNAYVGANPNEFSGSSTGTGAPPSGSDFISKTLGDFTKHILDPKNAPVTKMGMDLLAGMMNTKYKKATMAYQQKMGDAAALNAQTNEQVAAQRLAAGSAMGKTNFGTAMTPGNGLIYQNLLAERQARNGA